MSRPRGALTRLCFAVVLFVPLCQFFDADLHRSLGHVIEPGARVRQVGVRDKHVSFGHWCQLNGGLGSNLVLENPYEIQQPNGAALACKNSSNSDFILYRNLPKNDEFQNRMVSYLEYREQTKLSGNFTRSLFIVWEISYDLKLMRCFIAIRFNEVVLLQHPRKFFCFSNCTIIENFVRP